MKWLQSIAFTGSVLPVLVQSDTFDYGKLSQYNVEIVDKPEELSDNGIWLEEQDKNVRVILGDQVRDGLRDVVPNCKTVDNSCFQAVSQVINDAHIQTGDGLESNQAMAVGEMLVNNFQGVEEFKVWVGGYLAAEAGAAAMNMDETQKSHEVLYEENGSVMIWTPENVAENFAKVQTTASLTISAEGRPMATVTALKETAASATGPGSPAMTLDPPNALDSGDGSLEILLKDDDLGHRLGDYFRTTMDLSCEAGRAYDRDHPPDKPAKRASGTLGQVICAANKVVRDMQPHGPWDAILFMSTFAQLSFSVLPLLADEALQAVMEYGQAQATILGNAIVDNYASIVFTVYMMANLAIIRGAALTGAVKIPLKDVDPAVKKSWEKEKNQPTKTKATSSSATSTSTSTTSSACPTYIACGIEGEDCAPKFTDENGKKDVVCKDGKLEDCSCITPGLSFTKTFGGSPIKLPTWAWNKEPQCGSDKVQIWLDEGLLGPSSELCEGFNAKKESHSTKEMNYELFTYALWSWAINMEYKPSTSGRECRTKCPEAFSKLTQKCVSGAMISDTVSQQGTIDIGCGTFTYKVRDLNYKIRDQYGKAMAGIDTDPRNWKCGEWWVRGNKQYTDRCVCRYYGENCDGCDYKMELPIWGYGCEDADPCSACRPWEFRCSDRQDNCKRKNLAGCTQCHRTVIGNWTIPVPYKP